jgi:Leucine-rich repeat (LRR) protein
VPDFLGEGFRAAIAAAPVMRTLSRRTILCFSLAPILLAADDADWILKLGGKVERDGAGNVIAVNLGETWVNNTEMLDLVSLKKLQRLDLSHTRISDEGLLRLRPASQIQDLNLLYAEQITDLGMNAIKEWKNLKRLNVRGTRIADDTLVIVGKLVQLESLDVANTSFTDSGLDALSPLTNLKHLALGRNRLEDAAISTLRLLTTLESLDLSGTSEGRGRGRAMAEGLLQALAELKELRVLKLGNSDIDAAALRRLPAVLGKVERLSLDGCQLVNDQAVNELAAWKSLNYLDLQETAVTQSGVDTLKKVRPGIKILS